MSDPRQTSALPGTRGERREGWEEGREGRDGTEGAERLRDVDCAQRAQLAPELLPEVMAWRAGLAAKRCGKWGWKLLEGEHMQEEHGFHWSRAIEVILENYAGYTVRVLRQPPEYERDRLGFAECMVGVKGEYKGTFTLYMTAEGVVLDGRFFETASRYFRFPRRPFSNADWRELLAFVHRVLDTAPSFPEELGASLRTL